MKNLLTILLVTTLFSCQHSQPVTDKTDQTEKQLGVVYSSTLQTQINNLSSTIYNSNAALVTKSKNDSLKMQGKVDVLTSINQSQSQQIRAIYDSLKLQDTIKVGRGLAYDILTKTIYIP